MNALKTNCRRYLLLKTLVRGIARYDVAVGKFAAAELAQLRPRLVVNGIRLRNDGDLGPAMCGMSDRYLGIRLDYIGHIEQDDAVWLSVLRGRPLLVDSPTSKAARNIERIARRLLTTTSTTQANDPPTPISLTPNEPNLYDVLWSHRGASDEEVRRAYKRQKELYRTPGLALTSLLTEATRTTEQARIEEAHDTLLDPIRRRAYDASIFPKETEEEPKRNPQIDIALEAERAMLREELEKELNAETDFTGSLLCRVREAQGISLDEIAQHTKISSAYLRAIEAEDFPNLPALVYTRGFVQQLAKYLKLDPAQVTRTYLRRMRLWRTHSQTS